MGVSREDSGNAPGNGTQPDTGQRKEQGTPVRPARSGFAGSGTGARPWSRLDQALRAADLLLQGGGFNVLIFDLGSIAPEHVLRIPAATWFRFRAVAEASGTAFLLLSQAPCARSSAGLVLHFKPLHLRLAGGTVVESVAYEAELSRQRFQPDPQAFSNALPDALPSALPNTLSAAYRLGLTEVRSNGIPGAGLAGGSRVPRKQPGPPGSRMPVAAVRRQRATHLRPAAGCAGFRVSMNRLLPLRRLSSRKAGSHDRASRWKA